MAIKKDDKARPCFEFEGIKTLPLFVARMRLDEPLYAYGKAKASVQHDPPDYRPPPYEVTPKWLDAIGKDPKIAKEVVDTLSSHMTRFQYFVQLRDDVDKSLIQKLHSHIEIVILLSDARLSIDPAILSTCFRHLSIVSSIHSEYRGDNERDARYQEYSERLNRASEPLSDATTKAESLLQRISRQIELRSSSWSRLLPLHKHASSDAESCIDGGLNLFYCYSHMDESLRNLLQSHLSLLKRHGVIKEWHDRKIGAGNEWKGQIDANLESSRIILLLVSADFLASDYCFDIEMRRAMERHEERTARVIPIILRACDWAGAVFANLQALPTDARPITSWGNIDEAFTDVAKGIRAATDEMTKKALK